MENKVRKHVNNLFRTFKQDEQTLDTKEELISNLLDRIYDSVDNGMTEEDAFNKAIGNLGTKSDLKKIFNFKSLENINIEYKLNNVLGAIAVAVYLVLGFVFELWHPGWVVFILAIVFSEFKFKDSKTYLLPIVLIIYIFIGIMWDLWHPGWIVFPVGFVLLTTVGKKFGALVLMVGALYLILGVFFGNWLLFSTIFVLAAALIAGRDELVAGLWILTIAIYLFLGVMFNLWHPGWLVFLVTISITTLLVERSIVGFSWMASITAYLYLGFAFSLWHPSWIIFIVAAALSAYFDEDEESKLINVEVLKNDSLEGSNEE